MVILHSRTLAFISSLSTTIQSVLWIAIYILFMLAYGCEYKTKYFYSDGNSVLSSTSTPQDLQRYFVWYLQDNNCTTSPKWINGIRGQGMTVIVSLASVGLSWNVLLLFYSVYVLIGLHYNVMGDKLHWRVKFYSASLLLVSCWDILLIIFFGLDFSPILDAKNFNDDYTTNMDKNKPNIAALGFFIDVFTIIIASTSRFVLLWFLNVFFAAYLLLKNETRKPSPSQEIIYNSFQVTEPWEEKGVEKSFSHNEQVSKLKKLPLPPPDELPDRDEVFKRWNMTQVTDETPTPFVFTTHKTDINEMKDQNQYVESDAEDEWSEDEANHYSTDKAPQTVNNPSEEAWKEVQNDDNWVVRDEPMTPKIMKKDSFVKAPDESRRAIIRDIQNSLRKRGLVRNQSVNHDVPRRPESFSQIKPLQENPLANVKLRHVHRPSLTRDEIKVDSLDNSDAATSSSAYAVTNIRDIDPTYEPSNKLLFPSPSKYPGKPLPMKGNSSKLEHRPPPIPPPAAPPMKQFQYHAGFNHQMSLDEAIRTRRPLKPVVRPGIDTNC